MEHVIDIITDLIEDVSLFLGITTDILLIIFLGTLVLLLILLIVVKKIPKNKKGEEGKPGFIEVGPEPVIVYGRGKKQPAPPPVTVAQMTETEQSDKPLPQFNVLPQPEKEPEPLPKWSIGPLQGAADSSQQPDPDQASTKDETPSPPASDSRPQFKDLPLTRQPQESEQKLDHPEPDRFIPKHSPSLAPPASDQDSPFKRFMAADPREEVAVSFQPALSSDSLPRMESDFAGEILLLFSKQGFTIDKVAYHGTYGADFIVSRKEMKTYVQVKDWKKKATPRTVQEARYYSNTNGCHKTILIPIAGFTKAADREASLRAVHLWDQKTIKRIQTGELSLEQWIAASSF